MLTSSSVLVKLSVVIGNHGPPPHVDLPLGRFTTETVAAEGILKCYAESDAEIESPKASRGRRARGVGRVSPFPHDYRIWGNRKPPPVRGSGGGRKLCIFENRKNSKKPRGTRFSG